jgi:hypothetical protein
LQEASTRNQAGRSVGVTLLLVDDRDGRVVAEIASYERATRLLEAMFRSDSQLPEYLCLVELGDHPGALVGTQSSVAIRPLS